jgi:hypothetical protein
MALALFNNLPFETIMDLGDLLYREKRIERAFDIFREAAAKSCGDPRPYQRMAAMAQELGDIEGARRRKGARRRRTAVEGPFAREQTPRRGTGTRRQGQPPYAHG